MQLQYRLVLYPGRRKPTYCSWHDWNPDDLKHRAFFYSDTHIPFVVEFQQVPLPAPLPSDRLVSVEAAC